MIKALRSIKKRESDVHVENDLRGLGQTSVMGDMTPEPILTVRSSAVQNHHALADSFGCKMHAGLAPEGSELVHLHCTHANLTHKQKSLNLFGLALVLHKAHRVESHLWMHNRLRHEIHHGLEGTDSQHSAELPEASLVTSITLDSAVQHFLHQAGFDIHPKETSHTLTDHELQTYLKHTEKSAKHETTSHASTPLLKAV